MIERLKNAPPLAGEPGEEGDRHGAHPLDRFIKKGRIPHIWCPGCGIGIAFTAFVKALEKGGFDRDSTCVVSGIGCSGRAAGYLDLDTYHTTHGRAIPFATGLKLAKPSLRVVVFSGDGDLFAIGGNHVIHAARRNVDITVVCVNNFNYGMTGGQGGPTTPLEALTTTTPYGCAEHPFNLVYLAKAAGAVYVARWTVLHTYDMRDSMIEAMNKPGFSFVEIVSPCPTGYARRNKLGEPLDLMRFYRDNSFAASDLDPENTALPFKGRVAVGKFVDIEKPTFSQMYETGIVSRARGGKRKAGGERSPGGGGPTGGERSPGGRKFPGETGMPCGGEAGMGDRVREGMPGAGGGKVQLRMAGFGGQGIVLAGMILGKAACLYGGFNAVMTQSYGPEARGGACSADVVVSSRRIHYPRVTAPDILVLMSEEAARTWGGSAAEGATVLVNENLVKTVPARPGLRVVKIPATAMAEGLGRAMVANIVMLGFVAALSGVVGIEAMQRALLDSIPKGSEEPNVNALQAGYAYGTALAGAER